jgi:hypothetical protein
MDAPNPILWLAWACFGTYLVWVVWTRIRPAVLEADALPAPVEEEAELPAVPAWLFCEDGTTLDERVRWFALRPGGTTIIGSRPRAATEDTLFVYLTADDIQEDHARITAEPQTGRYQVEALGRGAVHHNNEPLEPGTPGPLADGDTLDLGRITRFRFTLTGPEEAAAVEAAAAGVEGR